MKKAVGIDIGGTKIAGVISDTGVLLERAEVKVILQTGKNVW